MRVLVAAAAALIVFTAAQVALAQNYAAPPPESESDPAAISSAMMYDACVANLQGPPTECACMSGFYGSRLNATEFRLLAVLTRFVDSNGNIADMPAVQTALRAEADRIGLTQQDFSQAMQRFATMDRDGAEGDRICRAVAAR